MPCKKEKWKAAPVEGYEVSNLGRVRSIDRVIIDTGKGGTPRKRRMRGKMLSSQPGGTSGGHLKICLGRGRRFWVHRLVWETFNGPIPAGMQVCHEDNRGYRNLLSNLRLDTAEGNAADRRLHGTHLEGERHPGSKLRVDQVKQIRALAHLSRTEVAERFGIHPNTVTGIVKRRTWAWL